MRTVVDARHELRTRRSRVGCALQAKQGRVPYSVAIKLVDDDGRSLPHDGTAFGHLLVRGHWIAAGYFRGEGGPIVDEGNWFDTGDIATIDPDGYMQITEGSLARKPCWDRCLTWL